MFCHNCGIPRMAGAKFCPGCGCQLPDLSNIPGMTAQEPPASPADPPARPISAAPVQVSPTPAPRLYVSELPATPPARAYVAPPPPPAKPYPSIPGVMTESPATAEDDTVAPPKKGRHRVPLLIMAAMVLIGLVLFIATSGKTAGDTPADAAQSASETPWFRNDGGTLYFDASLYTGSAELTVPETVDGEAVVCIAEDCFAGSTKLTTVILPDTLEEIGSGAFAGCSALRGIFIPEGVKLIGSGAFRDCVGLEAVCIPASVEAIGYNTFRGCINLNYILYGGEFREWNELYSGMISSGTKVYCADGTYPHEIILP